MVNLLRRRNKLRAAGHITHRKKEVSDLVLP
jgi:hypothetical protein